MYTHKEKPKGDKSNSFDRSVIQKKSNNEGHFQFIDNRTEAITQRKLQTTANHHVEKQPVQRKENNTGLPNQLKSGIENLSGFDMSDTRVHYNSPKPAQLQAHAYGQGTRHRYSYCFWTRKVFAS